MTDKEVERLWNELEDVIFDEDEDGRLILADNWYRFKKGDDRDEIWSWFDRNYSKGVRWLLYRDKEV